MQIPYVLCHGVRFPVVTSWGVILGISLSLERSVGPLITMATIQFSTLKIINA